MALYVPILILFALLCWATPWRGRTPAWRKRLTQALTLALAVPILTVIWGEPFYERMRADYVVESRREVVKGEIEQLAAQLERFYSDNDTYLGFPLCDHAGCTYSRDSPDETGLTHRYVLSLVALEAEHYAIRAMPRPDGPMVGDGFLQLTSAGETAWDRNNDGSIEAGETPW